MNFLLLDFFVIAQIHITQSGASQSAEQFLIELEDSLENGSITLDEARQLIADFNAR